MESYEMRIYLNRRRRKEEQRKKQQRRKRLVIVFIGGAVLLLLVVLALLVGRNPADGGMSPVEEMFSSKREGPPYAVALDAGHGGRDVGAEGIIREVELTERTVKYLQELLEKDESYTPLLCREYGEGATSGQRADEARKQGALLLLSVHGNSDHGEGSTGFECFPAPPGRKWHEDSLRFAGLLTGEMASLGSRLRGERGIRYAYYEEAGDGSDVKVFREASDTTEYEDPTFGVLERPDCPAVLVEQCFITTQSDYDAFGTDEGCRRAAGAYYRAICAFFGTTPL